jgi:hypothetical protein
VAEGTRLLSEYGGKLPSRVRIPPSPFWDTVDGGTVEQGLGKGRVDRLDTRRPRLVGQVGVTPSTVSRKTAVSAYTRPRINMPPLNS